MSENKTILVIEDNPSNMKLITTILQKCGYNVIQAVNGLEGIIQAKARRPDAILVDIQMPGIDGHQVMDKLRESWVTRAIPLIVLTASADVYDVLKARSNGALEYILKPITPKILAERLAHVLREPINCGQNPGNT